MPARRIDAFALLIAILPFILVPAPGAAGEAPAWQVSDTAQPGQRTVYPRTANGAGLGLPLGAGDMDGDGRRDLLIAPMNADSGPGRTRTRAGELDIVLSSGGTEGVLDLATIDPNDLPSYVTLVYGAEPFDFLGTEVFSADLDGDGFEDAILGAQHADGPSDTRADAGDAVIVWGSADIGGRVIDLAAPEAADRVTFLYGAHSGDRTGLWVSAGDFDGDGYPDAVIGADQTSGLAPNTPHAGATYIVYGGPELRAQRSLDLLAPALPVTVVHGIDAEDHSGCTVRAFDLDGDGAAEVLIGAGLNRLSAAVQGNGNFGAHGTAGGDGPDNTRREAGEAYIVYGATGSRPDTIDLAHPPASTVFIYGIDPGDSYGEELFAGDLDGDGHGDVVIGALTADGPDNTRSTAGEVAVIYGRADLPGSVIDLADPPAGVSFVYGAQAGEIGGDTALVLDVDGDGFDDLAFGSPRYTPDGRLQAGAITLLFGSSERLPASLDLAAIPAGVATFRIDGNDPNDMLDYSGAAGDIDGDGRVDLIFNAMAGDGFDNLLDFAGDVYAISGRALAIAAGREAEATATATATATGTPTVPPTATATVPVTATLPPSTTPTRSPTTAPTATATPSVTPTDQPTATATVAATPTKSSGGGSGCAVISPSHDGGSLAWLLPMALLWLIRRRRADRPSN